MPGFIPKYGVQVSALTEIIDKDDTAVDASDYSDSVEIEMGDSNSRANVVSGEIVQVVLTASELAGGAVLSTAGTLYIFDTDPAIAAGDIALAAAGAEHKTLLGMVAITSSDWHADAAGAAAHVNCSVFFHQLHSIYVAFQPAAGSTSINSAAGDDEELHVRLHWVRYS